MVMFNYEQNYTDNKLIGVQTKCMDLIDMFIET